jgi:hypothetical protein
MLLYRGTPEPESIPKLRAFDAIFFTTSRNEALDYATGGEQSDGYVQEYFAPDDLNLLDLDEPDGKAIADDFFGKRLGQQELIDLEHYPKKEWLQHVAGLWFDGVVRNYVIVFGVSGMKLLKRWELVYNDEMRRYDWKLVSESPR